MVIPSGQQASEEKVQEIQNEITTGEGPDVFSQKGRIRPGVSKEQLF